MNRGFLLYSFDSETVCYAKIANICARLIRYFIGEKVSVVTDNKDGLDPSLFDNIILIPKNVSDVRWRNSERNNYFNLTPYEETIVIDSDYLLFNNLLSNLFDNKESLILSKRALKDDFSEVDNKEKRLSPIGLDMIWATCFYFRKDTTSELFFDIVDYVKKHFEFFFSLYRCGGRIYRNDFVFSIATHLLSDSGQSIINYSPYPIYTAYPDTTIYEVKPKGLILNNKWSDSKLENMENLSIHVLNKKTILENHDAFQTLFN